jgi:hypothetical protein
VDIEENEDGPAGGPGADNEENNEDLSMDQRENENGRVVII